MNGGVMQWNQWRLFLTLSTGGDRGGSYHLLFDMV